MKQTCAKCQLANDRQPQKYCRACHAADMRDRRARQAGQPLRATVRGDTLIETTFACYRCQQASPQQGSSWRRMRGGLMHLCEACRKVLDQLDQF